MTFRPALYETFNLTDITLSLLHFQSKSTIDRDGEIARFIAAENKKHKLEEIEKIYSTFLAEHDILDQLHSFSKKITDQPCLGTTTPYYIKSWQRFCSKANLSTEVSATQYSEIRDTLTLIANTALSRLRIWYETTENFLIENTKINTKRSFDTLRTKAKRAPRGKASFFTPLQQTNSVENKIIFPYLIGFYQYKQRAAYIRRIKIAMAALAITTGIILTATGVLAPIGVFLKLLATKIILHGLALSLAKDGIITGNALLDSAIVALPLAGFFAAGAKMFQQKSPIQESGMRQPDLS